MADNDVFLKERGYCWKKMYLAACENSDAYEVAALAAEGLCKLLRSHNGFPSFTEFMSILEPFFVTSGQQKLFSGNFANADRECEILAGQYAGSGQPSVLVEIGNRVAKGILLEAQSSGILSGDPGETFVRRLLPEIVRARMVDVFDTAPKVIERFTVENGGALPGVEALHEFCDQVVEHLGQTLEPLVYNLANDPTGQSLPRRPQRLPKRSTAEAIEIVVG